MPKRILKWSKTEPARSILFLVGLLTFIAQLFVLGPWTTTPDAFLAAAFNFFIVGGIAAWNVWASAKHDIKDMSRASMGLFVVWLWSGLSRAIFTPDPLHLLWLPMIVVAVVVGVCHIYFQGLRKGVVRE